MKPGSETGLFHGSFERWARRVRLRLVLRRALTGLAIGLASGGVAAFVAWHYRHGAIRPWLALLGAAGAIAGAIVATRRRWSDGDVALYLDARLGTQEAISTAVELRTERANAERADAARQVVVTRAAKALAEGDPSRARPPVLARWHGIAPLAGVALFYVSWLPLPPAPPAPPPPPGAERVKLGDLKGLDQIIALEKLTPRSEADRERLKKIAEDAKKLRAQLKDGMEKREAQADVAKLRDEIAAQRLELGDEKNRSGLEAAVEQLQKNAATRDAAKALGDGNLVDFDREMQKLANKVEKQDRDEAKKALEEAEKAARAKGAGDVAKALEEQRKAFDQREAKAEALRELAKSLKGHLSEQAQKDLEEFGETGSPEAQKRLAESLEKALEGLTPEERKRLAERLQKQLDDAKDGAQPMTKEQIDEMAKRLASPGAEKELEKQLKELAKQDPSAESERQKGLGDADRGGAEAQRGLGVMPAPMAGGDGNPGSGTGDKPKSGKADGDGTGGPGSHHDTGTGDHKGSTGEIAGKELRSKASARINPGAPMQGTTMGRAPSRPGDTANQVGTGALGNVGPTELDGVERNQVPEEYREQVGRYFQP